MFDYDIFEIILTHIESAIDVFNFRLINKDTNKMYKHYFKKIRVDIMPRSTFINNKECYLCYSRNKTVKQLIYKYDSFPNKCLIHCENKSCYLSSIKKYLNDIKNNHIYPFCIIKKEHINLFKYKNKIVRDYYLDTLKKYNGNWYIKCDNALLSKIKYIKISNVNKLKNLNLFGWYLSRNKELIKV